MEAGALFERLAVKGISQLRKCGRSAELVSEPLNMGA